MSSCAARWASLLALSLIEVGLSGLASGFRRSPLLTSWIDFEFVSSSPQSPTTHAYRRTMRASFSRLVGRRGALQSSWLSVRTLADSVGMRLSIRGFHGEWEVARYRRWPPVCGPPPCPRSSFLSVAGRADYDAVPSSSRSPIVRSMCAGGRLAAAITGGSIIPMPSLKYRLPRRAEAFPNYLPLDRDASSFTARPWPVAKSVARLLLFGLACVLILRVEAMADLSLLARSMACRSLSRLELRRFANVILRI